jgi:hypothetical protein
LSPSRQKRLFQRKIRVQITGLKQYSTFSADELTTKYPRNVSTRISHIYAAMEIKMAVQDTHLDFFQNSSGQIRMDVDSFLLFLQFRNHIDCRCETAQRWRISRSIQFPVTRVWRQTCNHSKNNILSQMTHDAM